jgi:hypothetical protein
VNTHSRGKKFYKKSERQLATLRYIFLLLCSDILDTALNHADFLETACLGHTVKIYAIGGRTDTDFTGTNECYSPATDTWVTLKSMPTPRGDFIIVSCQGKIYCIGGVYGTIFPLSIQDLRSLDVVEVYDPVDDVWESKKSFTCSCRK